MYMQRMAQDQSSNSLLVLAMEGADEGLAEGDMLGEDAEDVRAALGGVASGLAEQLTTITQEMNKIREELYGDNGIGGIAQELEKLKSGSIGSLGDEFGHESRAHSEGVRESREVRRKPPLEKERKLEELRQRIERRHLLEEKKKEKSSFLEWFVIIFVLFLMIYTASSSFRTSVKHLFGEVFGASIDESPDDMLVEEDVESYF